MKRIAVVQVRGLVKTPEKIKRTLKELNLGRVNHCVVVDDRPSYSGMLKKAEPWITWGEINNETMAMLLGKRGRLVGDKRITDDYLKEKTRFKGIKEFVDAFMSFEAELNDIPDLKPVFRLSPPSKGYRSIKRGFKAGGDLGYRGEEINSLLKRMI